MRRLIPAFIFALSSTPVLADNVPARIAECDEVVASFERVMDARVVGTDPAKLADAWRNNGNIWSQRRWHLIVDHVYSLPIGKLQNGGRADELTRIHRICLEQYGPVSQQH